MKLIRLICWLAAVVFALCAFGSLHRSLLQAVIFGFGAAFCGGCSIAIGRYQAES